MRRVRIFLILGSALAGAAIIALLVQEYLIPRLPAAPQTWLLSALAGIVSAIGIFASVAQITGFTLRDFVSTNSQKEANGDATLPRWQIRVTSSDVQLHKGGIQTTENGFALAEDLTLTAFARVCVHNPGTPTYVQMKVADVKPAQLAECLSEGVSPERISVHLMYKKQPDWASANLGNPFLAEQGDRVVEVKADIPLCVERVEKAFGSLYGLKNLSIPLTLQAVTNGEEVAEELVLLDLAPIHRAMETEVAKVLRYPGRSTRPVDVEQALRSLKRYWLGPNAV